MSDFGVINTSGAAFSGNMTTETPGNLAVNLKSGTAYVGRIGHADVSLDSSSSWTISSDSTVAAMSNADAISGLTVANITGNGHNVYYDSTISANNYLGGLSYSLQNGGYLMPLEEAVVLWYVRRARIRLPELAL